jgi:hypothetical protein
MTDELNTNINLRVHPTTRDVLDDVRQYIEKIKCLIESDIDPYLGDMTESQYNYILLSIYTQERRFISIFGEMRDNVDLLVIRYSCAYRIYSQEIADINFRDEFISYYRELCSSISRITYISRRAANTSYTYRISSTIENKQIIGYVTKDKNECLNLDCPICLDSKDTDNMCQTNCNHYFCLGCIKTHEGNEKFQMSKIVTCPMCREPVTQVKVFK